MKHGIHIVEFKKTNCKKVYNNGHLMARYFFQPKRIHFRSPLVNDTNQHYCGGWRMSDLDYSASHQIERVGQGSKPAVVLYGDASEVLEFENDATRHGLNSLKKPSWQEGKFQFMVFQSGTLESLFDLRMLEKDYLENELPFWIDPHKSIGDYFEQGNWDAGANNDTQFWETGLILGYPVENTISLMKGGVK